MPPIVVSDFRRPEHPVDPLFVHRWSPRAMSGDPIAEHQLLTLLEAARWAPSSYNEQPWRFCYGKRGTPNFDLFMSFLMEANQVWCKGAAVLLVLMSKKTFSRNGKPNSVHTFDAGAAWENLALQASAMGLVAHGMAGFDPSKACSALGVPDDFELHAMIAVGKPGRIDDLPSELREMEKPSPRHPIAQWAFEGKFRG
ncbi:MAG: nitroreductase family protein [Phycisphaerae bacterium]|nr:nitroreductase family protein [Phycisphaerae bacterium]